MIHVRLQIGDGPIEDTFKKWGLIYVEAEHRTEAPIKGRETTSYIEDAGEHVDPRTVQDAFDYSVTFLIECPNKDMLNANEKIAAFNRALYTQESDSDIRTYKEITFYNDYKRVNIVGLPEPIAEPKEFYRRQDGSVMDCVEVELKIRVTDPTKCDFSTSMNFAKAGGVVYPVNQIAYEVEEESGSTSIYGFSSQPGSEYSDADLVFLVNYIQNAPSESMGAVVATGSGAFTNFDIPATDFTIDLNRSVIYGAFHQFDDPTIVISIQSLTLPFVKADASLNSGLHQIALLQNRQADQREI